MLDVSIQISPSLHESIAHKIDGTKVSFGAEGSRVLCIIDSGEFCSEIPESLKNGCFCIACGQTIHILANPAFIRTKSTEEVTGSLLDVVAQISSLWSL